MNKNGLRKSEIKAIKKMLTTKQQVTQEDLLQARKCLLEEASPEPNRSKTHIADSNGGPSVYQAIITNKEKCLKKISEAFENLELGIYGICKGCGDPIPFERLEIVPFAQLCVPCKS